MAKTISGNVCNDYVHIDLILEEIGTDVNTNSSTVAWKLVGWLGKADNCYWYGNNYHTISVKINGSTVYSLDNTTAKSISIGTNKTQACTTIGRVLVAGKCRWIRLWE